MKLKRLRLTAIGAAVCLAAVGSVYAQSTSDTLNNPSTHEDNQATPPSDVPNTSPPNPNAPVNDPMLSGDGSHPSNPPNPPLDNPPLNVDATGGTPGSSSSVTGASGAGSTGTGH